MIQLLRELWWAMSDLYILWRVRQDARRKGMTQAEYHAWLGDECLRGFQEGIEGVEE